MPHTVDNVRPERRQRATRLGLAVVLAFTGACQGDSGDVALENSNHTSSADSALTASGAGPITSAVGENKCVDVAGGNTANGTAVQLATCNGGSAQAWTYADGALKVFGNKCLDVVDGRADNGTQLQIWDCVGGAANQMFKREGDTFIWRDTFCLDLTDGNSSDGTRLQVWNCGVGNKNQAWSLNASTGSSSDGLSAGGAASYKLRSNGNLCLDVANGTSGVNGSYVQLGTCNGGPTQAWTLKNGAMRIFGKCIDIPYSNMSNGTMLQLYECSDNNPAQQWVWNGTALQVAGQNKCLDVPGGNMQVGQRLQIWDCDGNNNNQKWASSQAAGGGSSSNAGSGTKAPAPAPAASSPSANNGGGSGQPAGSLNVQNYGARADGSTDNTQALQNAFNAAKSSGQIAWIPAGQYNHSGAITADGIRVVGAGSGTIIHATQQYGSALILTGNGAQLSNITKTVNASQRSSQPKDCAILVSYASNATVNSVSVQGASANGIRVDASSNTKVTNCFVNGSNADGIALVNGTTGTLVQHCQVNNASDDSYSSNSYPGERQSSGNVFDSCYAGPNYKQGRSFCMMGSANETIRNCVSVGSLWHGIVAGTDPSSTTQSGWGFTISHNLVMRNASGQPVFITSDGGMNSNPSLANVSGTMTSGDPASVLGWTPGTNIPDPSTFSSYTGGGPGSSNTPGNRQ